jgi:hypothetical protein
MTDKCVKCGADTVLFINGTPVCVGCALTGRETPNSLKKPRAKRKKPKAKSARR